MKKTLPVLSSPLRASLRRRALGLDLATSGQVQTGPTPAVTSAHPPCPEQQQRRHASNRLTRPKTALFFPGATTNLFPNQSRNPLVKANTSSRSQAKEFRR